MATKVGNNSNKKSAVDQAILQGSCASGSSSTAPIATYNIHLSPSNQKHTLPKSKQFLKIKNKS